MRCGIITSVQFPIQLNFTFFQFAEKLASALGKKKKKHEDINLITYVESAKGLLDLRDICSRAIELSEFHLFNLVGIVFGSDDFCANIGKLLDLILIAWQ